LIKRAYNKGRTEKTLKKMKKHAKMCRKQANRQKCAKGVQKCNVEGACEARLPPAPNLLGKQSIYNLSHSQLFIQNEAVQEKGECYELQGRSLSPQP
jgi:hypothetical protein